MKVNEVADLMSIHGQHKAGVIDGSKCHADMIYATVMTPTSKHFEITRPPQWDGHQFIFHTRYEDYNDPFPVMKEIDVIIAKLQQVKIAFVEAWKQHMTKTDSSQTKVTLDEIEKLEFDFEDSRVKAKRFSELALPLFSQMWNDNVRGPYQRLRAFGVCHQDYAELRNASDGEARYQQYPGNGYVEMTFKGVPIVQDDRARTGVAVPIYKYGYEHIDKINYYGKPSDLDEASVLGHDEPVQQLYCGKEKHSKKCRCHQGYRVRKD